MPNPLYQEGLSALSNAISHAEEYELIISKNIVDINKTLKGDCPFDKLMELAAKVISIKRIVNHHFSEANQAKNFLQRSWKEKSRELQPLTDSLLSSYRESLGAIAKQIGSIPSEKWPNAYRLQWERVKALEGKIDNENAWDTVTEVLQALPYEGNT
jgi:hypothetical protein